MQFAVHCTAAALAVVIGSGVGTISSVPGETAAAAVSQAAGQAPTKPAAEADVEFTLFLSGQPAGTEHVRIARAGSTWVISSTARFVAPLNITINRFEVKYTADWQPIELHIEATQAGRPLALATSFGMTTAINEITQNGTTTSKTDQVSARTIVIPNSLYAGYEALAARLAETQPGTQLHAYVVPQTEIG